MALLVARERFHLHRARNFIRTVREISFARGKATRPDFPTLLNYKINFSSLQLIIIRRLLIFRYIRNGIEIQPLGVESVNVLRKEDSLLKKQRASNGTGFTVALGQRCKTGQLISRGYIWLRLQSIAFKP